VNARKVRTLLQVVLYVLNHTQPTIEGAKSTRTFKNFTETPHRKPPGSNSKPNFFSTPSSSRDPPHQDVPNQLHNNAKPSYAHTTSKRNTASNLDTQDSIDPKSPTLTSFLEEFKSLITSLISLLTSLITKLFSHIDK